MSPMVRAALLFAAGCALSFVIGVFAGRAMGGTRARGVMNPDTAVASLTRELRLDTTQQAQIRAVFQRHQAAVDEAWRSLQPRVRGAIDSTQMEVLNILRPDQRRRFIEILRVTHPGMPVIQPAER